MVAPFSRSFLSKTMDEMRFIKRKEPMPSRRRTWAVMCVSDVPDAHGIFGPWRTNRHFCCLIQTLGCKTIHHGCQTLYSWIKTTPIDLLATCRLVSDRMFSNFTHSLQAQSTQRMHTTIAIAILSCTLLVGCAGTSTTRNPYTVTTDGTSQTSFRQANSRVQGTLSLRWKKRGIEPQNSTATDFKVVVVRLGNRVSVVGTLDGRKFDMTASAVDGVHIQHLAFRENKMNNWVAPIGQVSVELAESGKAFLIRFNQTVTATNDGAYWILADSVIASED